MNIFVYSDESGVFDKEHNDVFVFGGAVFLCKEEKDKWTRKYIHAEETIRKTENVPAGQEVKAATISNGGKSKLFRSLNGVGKFAVVIKQKDVMDRIFIGKKDKQRYLDFAYKIGLKRYFEHMILTGKIIPDEIENIYIFVDEHTTATNGCYELREGLEQEFKFGTFNWNYNKYYPPIFPRLNSVNLTFCNSASTILIRAADVVANRVYYLARNDILDEAKKTNMFFTYLP